MALSAVASYTVSITDIAAQPCVLAGYPSPVIGVEANGTEVTLDPGHQPPAQGGGGGGGIEAAGGVLKPGQAGQEEIWNGICPSVAPVTTYTRLLLGAGGGGSVALDGALQLCNFSVSTMGPLSPLLGYVHPPWGSLNSSIQVPDTVVAGTLLRFTLTASNPTGAAIALSPCPGYALRIPGGVPELPLVYYELNCASAHPVPAGGQETFALESPIPASSAGHYTMPILAFFSKSTAATSPSRFLAPFAPPNPTVIWLTVLPPATPSR